MGIPYRSPISLTKFKGAKRDIAFAGTLIVAPMLIFSISLIVLVQKNLLQANALFLGKSDSSFPVPALADKSVYYVTLSAGSMSFISSWSSTIALALVGYAMLLLSYPIARLFENQSRSDRTDTLPTPFQLGLLLNFINSGPARSLWEWSKYRWGWTERRQYLASPLVTLAVCTCTVTVILSSFILISDTWLHLSLDTIEFVRISVQELGGPLYSREIIPGCINESYPYYDIDFSERYCIIPGNFGVAPRLANAQKAIQVINNVSTEHTVATVVNQYQSKNYTYAFLAAPELVGATGKEDFQAISIGAYTTCLPNSKFCNLTANGLGNITYDCPNSAALSRNGSVTDGWSFGVAPARGTYFNPLTYDTAMFLEDNWASPLRSDPNVSFEPNGYMGFVLLCSTSIVDIEYTFNNGNLSLFVESNANTSVGEMIMAPWIWTNTGFIPLKQQVQLAVMESSIQTMADDVALAISKITIGMASGVMISTPTTYHQNRTVILATVVPKAPLYALVGSNLLMALCGLVLAGFAWTSLDGEGRVRGVQARLGFNGLLAGLFEGGNGGGRDGIVEGIEDLFEERNGDIDGDGRKTVGVLEHEGMLTFVANI